MQVQAGISPNAKLIKSHHSKILIHLLKIQVVIKADYDPSSNYKEFESSLLRSPPSGPR
ncbi:hypothetical protein CLV95_11373 [Leptospira borgpetersenii serovar Javanica]|nr:hypothetical protein CLV95_11373 [Leptospira borgpetersenii serovar Javanica]